MSNEQKAQAGEPEVTNEAISLELELDIEIRKNVKLRYAIAKKDAALQACVEALESNQPVNYWVNGAGEKSPVLINYPLRFERNAAAIQQAQEALK